MLNFNAVELKRQLGGLMGLDNKTLFPLIEIIAVRFIDIVRANPQRFDVTDSEQGETLKYNDVFRFVIKGKFATMTVFRTDISTNSDECKPFASQICFEDNGSADLHDAFHKFLNQRNFFELKSCASKELRKMEKRYYLPTEVRTFYSV